MKKKIATIAALVAALVAIITTEEKTNLSLKQQIKDYESKTDSAVASLHRRKSDIDLYNNMIQGIDKIDPQLKVVDGMKLGYLNILFNNALDIYNIENFSISPTELLQVTQMELQDVFAIQDPEISIKQYSLALSFDAYSEPDIFNFIEYVKSFCPGMVVTTDLQIETVELKQTEQQNSDSSPEASTVSTAPLKIKASLVWIILEHNISSEA